MKNFFLFILISVLCLPVKAQTPYYGFNHKGEKVYLSLNTEHAFLSVKEPQLPEGFAQRGIKADGFLSDKSDQRQYQSKKRDVPRFCTRLSFEEKLSDDQYLKLLADLKQRNKDVILSPYFKMEGGSDIIGLSNYFYIKLKTEADTTLLRKIAEQKNCIIIDTRSFYAIMVCIERYRILRT